MIWGLYCQGKSRFSCQCHRSFCICKHW